MSLLHNVVFLLFVEEDPGIFARICPSIARELQLLRSENNIFYLEKKNQLCPIASQLVWNWDFISTPIRAFLHNAHDTKNYPCISLLSVEVVNFLYAALEHSRWENN